jgi:hypothetical protein
MKIYNSSDFVDVIDVTLFKYNHYDNLIWTKCLNQLDYMRVDDESILVTPYQLETMFEYNFEKEIRRIKAITFELIHKDASSLFFLHKIVEDFGRLKWIKLTLSKRRNFSRVIEDFENTTRQIKYSYKILRATVRLSEFIDVHEIKKINPLLRSAGLIGEKPYNSMPIKRLTMGVESILGSEDMSDQTAESLAMILDIIDHKLEGDNPEVLLVTDW